MVPAQLWPLLWFMVAPVILLLVSHKLLPFFLSPVWIVASLLWAIGAAFVAFLSKPMPNVQSLRPVQIRPQLRRVLMMVSMVTIFMILADTPIDVLWSRPQCQM